MFRLLICQRNTVGSAFSVATIDRMDCSHVDDSLECLGRCPFRTRHHRSCYGCVSLIAHPPTQRNGCGCSSSLRLPKWHWVPHRGHCRLEVMNHKLRQMSALFVSHNLSLSTMFSDSLIFHSWEGLYGWMWWLGPEWVLWPYPPSGSLKKDNEAEDSSKRLRWNCFLNLTVSFEIWKFITREAGLITGFCRIRFPNVGRPNLYKLFQCPWN